MSNRMMWATDAERQEIVEYQNKMSRSYHSGQAASAEFFTGKEVEQTPYFGLNTLFVVGLHTPMPIQVPEDVEHIFFGANHSYRPKDLFEANAWYVMIANLAHNYKVSIDVSIDYLNLLRKSKTHKIKNLCVQIRVPVESVEDYNSLTMLKIDDKTFDYSNPGIWTMPLSDICTTDNFTDWQAYAADQIVK